MPIKIRDYNHFLQYLRKVQVRAAHHAESVENIILILANKVWRMKPSKIEVRGYRGETKNTAWVERGGKRFVFTYDYENEAIILKAKSLQGGELTRFDNSDGTKSIQNKLKTHLK